MVLDIEKSGAVVLPPNSTGTLVLGVIAWDFIAVDPADDNVICEVQSLDGKAEFRILGSMDEEAYPGTGLGPDGEWGVIHGENRLTADAGESFSTTYTKHPFMVVLADNPSPVPVTVQAIMYGRDSLGDPSTIPVSVGGSWNASSISNQNSITVSGIMVDASCTYFTAVAISDSNALNVPTGMGLTWSLINEQADANDVRLAVYRGSGVPTGPGTVTCTTASGNASWAVNVVCLKRADQADPVFGSVATTGSSGPALATNIPTDSNSILMAYIAFDGNSTYDSTAGTTPVGTVFASNKVRLHIRKFSPTDGNPRDVAGDITPTANWVVVGVGVRRA